MKKLRNILIIGIVSAIILGYLEYKGIIWHNSVFAMKYEVKGLDVSHYQGNIDWNTLTENNKFSFIYLKATEGHDYIDDTFKDNWNEAKTRNLLTGAYHFFSMRSSGLAQGDRYIAVVPKEVNNMPPVIDLEISLDHERDKVKQELEALANKLEDYYGQKPILYVTYDTYDAYVKGNFEDYDLWIRDILKFPTLGDRKWLLWQYCNRGRIDGIEAYTDINVFNGDLAEFKQKFG